jgi:ABC-type multidrug transport system ATPase subunit
MQVRLGFAVSTILKPDILLLDEVLAVGDVSFRAKCFNTLGEMRKSGSAFILVSHNTQDILRHCDKVIFLERGIIRHMGDPATSMNLYLSQLREEMKSKTSDFIDGFKVNGSGRLKIKDVLLNDLKSPIKIKPGESLKISIHYDNSTFDNISFIFDITIYDDNGTMFQTSINKDCHDNELVAKANNEMKLNLNFPFIHSNNQNLHITFSLWDKFHKELFDWKRNLYISVSWDLNNVGNNILKYNIDNINISN